MTKAKKGDNLRPHLSHFHDPIVFFKVGPDQLSFGVHKGLLCQVSFYFRTVLTGAWKEALEGPICLYDEDLDVFRRFIDWLYTHEVVYQEDKSDPDYTTLMKLYVFAEKRIIPGLQNTVINAIIRTYYSSDEVPGPALGDAWENASEKSGLRRLLADFYVHLIMKNTFEVQEDQSLFAKDFLVKVILSFYDAVLDGSIVRNFDFWKKRCKYHVHEPHDPPCKGPMPLWT